MRKDKSKRTYTCYCLSHLDDADAHDVVTTRPIRWAVLCALTHVPGQDGLHEYVGRCAVLLPEPVAGADVVPSEYKTAKTGFSGSLDFILSQLCQRRGCSLGCLKNVPV